MSVNEATRDRTNGKLLDTVRRLQHDASTHRVFALLTSAESLRRFVEFHVWCVWDFMCLAKSVQAGLAGNPTLWSPSSRPDLLRIMNEIIADEETDIGPAGNVSSHFEIFLDAMSELRADTGPMRSFHAALSAGYAPTEAAARAKVHPAATRFIRNTIQSCSSPMPARAACFALARETLVPQMLTALRAQTSIDLREFPTFFWYVNRHIQLDLETHGSKSMHIFSSLVEDDFSGEEAAFGLAIRAIEARLAYLDSISTSLDTLQQIPGKTSSMVAKQEA